MSLIEELTKGDKKKLFSSDDHFVMYPTGITAIDYANGFWQETRDKKGNITYVASTGIMGGSFVGIIGIHGTGKSTLADQIAWNIIKPFENGLMIHIDAEKTTFKDRIARITGASINDSRIVLNKDATMIEDTLDQFHQICELKELGGKKYKYTVKGRSYDGHDFDMYVPTVIIIDSLPSFNSKTYDTDTLGTNMDQMRAAKDINRFYIDCLDDAYKYNITMIAINHIVPNTEINPYAAPPRGLLSLGAMEKLPRGQGPQYYTQTYIRINSKKSDIYTQEDHGFSGRKATFQLAKTKSNVYGTTFPVCYNSARGFDPIYSIFEFASSMGLINGRNPHLYVGTMEDMKFSRREFTHLMIRNTDFRDRVLDQVRPAYESLLGVKPVIEEDDAAFVYGDIGL